MKFSITLFSGQFLLRNTCAIEHHVSSVVSDDQLSDIAISVHIGFALYLDMLDWLNTDDEELDADVLILYDSKTEADFIAESVNNIISGGESVAAFAEMPQKGKYGRIVKIKERGLENIETVD